MPAALPAPLVVGPVSTWSKTILIADLVAGVKLEILARTRDGQTQSIMSTDMGGSGEQHVSIPAQASGTFLWARQSLNADFGESENLAVPVADLNGAPAGLPQLVSRPFVGGGALWIESILPGAIVRVEQNGTLASGEASPLASIMNHPIGVRLKLSQHLVGNQDIDIVVSTPDGQEIARRTYWPVDPRAEIPNFKDRELPPVKIASPLFTCSSGVPLSGVADGAEVTLFVNGEERAVATFDRPSLTFNLFGGDVVKESDIVQASQQLWSTGPSSMEQKEPVLAAPAPGQLFASPPCAGKRMLGLAGVDSEATISVRMAQANAAGALEDVVVTFPPGPATGPELNYGRTVTLPAPLLADTTLTIWQSRCENDGPTNSYPVSQIPADPVTPVVMPPLRGCEEYVYADGVRLPFMVFSGKLGDASGAGLIGGAISGWTYENPVRVTPRLERSDKISVMYLGCNDGQIWSVQNDDSVVKAGMTEQEALQVAQNLVFSMTSDPNIDFPLTEGYREVLIQKAPRGQLLTLTGGAYPQLLGQTVTDKDGIAWFKLSRPLVADEELMVEWVQCDRVFISKGNRTGKVGRRRVPAAPKIEKPGNGEVLSLGDNVFRVTDPGWATPAMAEQMSLDVQSGDGSRTYYSVTTPGQPSREGHFDISKPGEAHRIRVVSSNAAGASPESIVNFRSAGDQPGPGDPSDPNDPQPAGPAITVKTEIDPNKSTDTAFQVDVTIDGRNFPQGTAVSFTIGYMQDDSIPVENVPFGDAAADAAGTFHYENAAGIPKPLNTGIKVEAYFQIGGQQKSLSGNVTFGSTAPLS